MGLIGQILGVGRAAEQIGGAVGGVAEVFVGNQASRDANGHERFTRALDQYEAEFALPAGGRFDQIINGLNRLPRPMLALGTLGLFVYAMSHPSGFSERMLGLAVVPEPLWWLLGVIVSFYFGARELHHLRVRTRVPAAIVREARGVPDTPRSEPERPAAAVKAIPGGAAGKEAPRITGPEAPQANGKDRNAALEDWKKRTAKG